MYFHYVNTTWKMCVDLRLEEKLEKRGLKRNIWQLVYIQQHVMHKNSRNFFVLPVPRTVINYYVSLLNILFSLSWLFMSLEKRISKRRREGKEKCSIKFKLKQFSELKLIYYFSSQRACNKTRPISLSPYLLAVELRYKTYLNPKIVVPKHQLNKKLFLFLTKLNTIHKNNNRSNIVH